MKIYIFKVAAPHPLHLWAKKKNMGRIPLSPPPPHLLVCGVTPNNVFLGWRACAQHHIDFYFIFFLFFFYFFNDEEEIFFLFFFFF